MARSVDYQFMRGAKAVKKLLIEGSEAKLALLLFRAWAKEKFGAGSPDYLLALSVIKKQDTYNEDSVVYLQSSQDKIADSLTTGVRTLAHLERVYAEREKEQIALAERIRVMKETQHKVIPFSRLKAKQEERASKVLEFGQKPQGAA